MYICALFISGPKYVIYGVKWGKTALFWIAVLSTLLSCEKQWWVGLCAANARVAGWIPDLETKIPYAAWCGQKIKKINKLI